MLVAGSSQFETFSTFFPALTLSADVFDYRKIERFFGC